MSMARNSFNTIQSAPTHRRPMSPLVPLLLVLVLLIGGMVLLSRSAKDQPLKPIEVDVARDTPAR